MSNKAEVLAMLAKIGPDEPLFLLRAQDCLADDAVRYWSDRAFDHGGVPGQKMQDADDCAEAMRQWPDRRLPD